MILNYLFLSSEPLNSDITMKNQVFPEYTLFLRNILSHISYPKEAEDGEQSNELKIQGLNSKLHTTPVEMRHANNATFSMCKYKPASQKKT